MSYLMRDGHPNELAMFIELMRECGKFNMIMEFLEMFRTALVVGIYLGHDLYDSKYYEPGVFESIQAELISCYGRDEYRRDVEGMVMGLSYSNNYNKNIEKYDNKNSSIKPIDLLIEKAENICIKMAKRARTYANIKSLQTTDRTLLIWGGLQLLQHS